MEGIRIEDSSYQCEVALGLCQEREDRMNDFWMVRRMTYESPLGPSRMLIFIVNIKMHQKG